MFIRLLAISVFVLGSIALSSPVSAQQKDDILGEWLTKKKDGKIMIYKKGGKYYGKVSWQKDDIDPETGKEKRDKHNPDPSKRDRLLQGMDIVLGMQWDPDDKRWEDGEVYNPEDGKSYSAYLELVNPNKLKLRGYLGFSLLGKSTYWRRIKQ